MSEDTSFVIDLLRGNARAIELMELIEGKRRPEKLAAITVLELNEGIRRSARPENETRCVLSVLDSKHVLAADQGITV